MKVTLRDIYTHMNFIEKTSSMGGTALRTVREVNMPKGWAVLNDVLLALAPYALKKVEYMPLLFLGDVYLGLMFWTSQTRTSEYQIC